MFNCNVCNDRGQVVVKVYAGLYEFIPCDCQNKSEEEIKRDFDRVMNEIYTAYEKMYNKE